MTSDEVEVYRPQSADLTINRQTTDDWYASFANIVKLAEYVADTEFVPDAMRRKPAAVAAAILTGREMNLPPMVSLRHLFVVHGRVGQSAELMRAQVYRAGHEIRYIEATDQRCIVEGRRNDEADWTRIQYTTADARTDGVDTRRYPADKLVARATSRLARRKFPDAVMGLPTIDELEDNTEPGAVVELAAEPAAPVQRKRATKKPRAAATQPLPVPRPAVAAAGNDDDDLLDNDETGAGQTADKSGNSTAEPSEPPPAPQTLIDLAADEPQPPATKQQHAKIQVLFWELGVTERDDQITIISHILGYDFTQSRSKLTKNEANTIIDTIQNWQAVNIADDRTREILNQAALAQAEQDDNES